MDAEQLEITDAPDAVPAARRFTHGALARLGALGVADAVELVVSELVTNAALHAGFPVRLALSSESDAVRVEVFDTSRDIPVRAHRAHGMTGRGLALVAAVAEKWGADPRPEGKVIWAEITPHSAAAEEPGEAALDDILSRFADLDDTVGAPEFTVTLGDVPTELLLEAKGHVESVIRELTLSASGAASGMSAALPAHLADLVHSVVTEFSAARNSIKRQALAAAEHGRPRTTLTLTLPASAADAGERYLKALEDADAFARASRLLTLAAPPQHRAFRRWYVTSLVNALRSKAADVTPPRSPTFEEYLLAQVDELAALQEVSNRAARLQQVTAALAAELGAERAAELALGDAMAELGAQRGCVFVMESGWVRSAANNGYPPELYSMLLAGWAEQAELPAVSAARTGEPVWLESREDCAAQFPLLTQLEPDVAALCAVPMAIAGHVVGILRLSFAESRLFTFDERAFLVALGAVTAQSLERASLYQSQATVAARLTRLQQVTAALSQVRTLNEVLDVTIEHATGLVGAQVASLSLLDADGATIRLLRVHPAVAGSDAWSTYQITDDLPAATAVRTGEMVVIDSVADRNRQWPALASLDSSFEHRLVVLPLHADHGTVGVLTLSFAADVHDSEPAWDFLTAFADACAQAVARAQAADRADDANRKLAFLARASEELAASLDVGSTLASVARLAVQEVADWCVVHLLRNGELDAVAIEHADSEKRAMAIDVQRRWPERLADPTAVAAVVRSGAAVRVADIPAYVAQMPVTVERDPEHTAFIEQLGLQSAMIVPLRGRGRTLGAMTFLTAESGRHYTASDQAFVEDLSRRAAIAIENSTLFHESTVAAAARLGGGGHQATESVRDPLLAAASIGRFEIDLASRTIDADDIIAQLFCLTEDDDVGSLDAHLQRVHPDDVARVEAAMAEAVRAYGDYSVEYRVVPPDSPLRWVAARGRVVAPPDGGRVTLAGVMYESTAVRERRDQIARVLETMSDAFYRLDKDWRFTYINSQAERLLYRQRADLLGNSVWACYPDLVGGDFEANYRSAQSTGSQVTFEMYYAPLASWFEVRATPDPEGLSVFFADVTARKEAEAARTVAHDRLALLGEAARGLVGTLDVPTVMQQVASVVVPRLADWAVVTMVDVAAGSGESHGLHRDPVVAAEMERLAELAPQLLPILELEDTVFAGSPLLRRTVDIRSTGAAQPGAELEFLLETLGFASLMVVPLQSRTAVIGVLTLVNGPGRSPFDDQDVATAVDIGRRAGLALENAQLYARQRNASEVLQRSLLTPLPEPDHLHVVARYRPAGQEAQIGGDWYDAFLQPDGATVLAIGDVVGHDMNAAAAMGQLRNLLRGVSFDRQDTPAAVLRRVDAAIRGLRIDTLATAVVGRLEQSPEQRKLLQRTFRWSNAGHPPALLLRGTGEVVVLDSGADLLLGFDPETDRTDHSVIIDAGDTLLLYTDGLVERRDSPLDEGLIRLQGVFSELLDVELEELCDRLVEALLPEDADDDVALVAVRAFREDRPRPLEAGPENVPPNVPAPG